MDYTEDFSKLMRRLYLQMVVYQEMTEFHQELPGGPTVDATYDGEELKLVVSMKF